MIKDETIQRIIDVTFDDTSNDYILLSHATEELGELAAAMNIEDGIKDKPKPKEDSSIEAIDTAICALSLYFRRGGTKCGLDNLINCKLEKWEARLL